MKSRWSSIARGCPRDSEWHRGTGSGACACGCRVHANGKHQPEHGQDREQHHYEDQGSPPMIPTTAIGRLDAPETGQIYWIHATHTIP